MGKKKELTIDGVWYESISDACRALHISSSNISGLARKYHISVPEALEMCLHRAKDHQGRSFRSMAEMCRYHGVNVSTFYSRLDCGLPLEMCLSRESFRGNRYPVYKYLK